MPRKTKSDGVNCPLCEHEMEVLVSAHVSKPFIDGRCYEQMCFVCSNVPKTWHYDDKTDELVTYPWHPDLLCSVEDFQMDGFPVKAAEDKKRVQDAIKSVRKSISKHLSDEARKKMIEVHNAKTLRTYIDPDAPEQAAVLESRNLNAKQIKVKSFAESTAVPPPRKLKRSKPEAEQNAPTALPPPRKLKSTQPKFKVMSRSELEAAK